MIVKIILFTCLACTISASKAQEKDSLQDYFLHQKDITIKGMKILRTWGAVNLGVGIVGEFNSEGTAFYFHQMNSLWGGFNLLFSSLTIRAVRRQEPITDYSYWEMKQIKLEKIFLINAGFDVLFIGAGAGMLNLSTRDGVEKERLEGYGYSVIMQASSLLIFDSILYLLHKRNRKKRMSRLIRTDIYLDN